MRHRLMWILAAGASLSLAGCSSSMDRFTTAGSDATPATQTATAYPSDAVASTPLSGSTVQPVQSQSLYATPVPAQPQAAPQQTAALTPPPAAAPAPAPAPAQAAKPQAAYAAPDQQNFATNEAGSEHVVKAGETLYSLGRSYKLSPFAIADLNQLPHNAVLTTGQRLRIPGGAAAAAPAEKSAAVPAAPAETAPAVAEVAPQPQPQAETEKQAAAATAAPAPEAPAAANEAAPAETAAASADPAAPAFRWPVSGRVISGFGAKPNGLRNEGVNIAVPEGTSVKAAESGVVAYAGNELKGYGNLILIRHDNGWVTAYAHNKDLLVKRGDTVKVGDVIARSGQTGSVDAPQLHFEVRKGATAMDPMKFLGASTAAN